jgi:Domain of unknown function (DUF4345)
MEKRLLQVAVAMAGLVPVGGGMLVAIWGAGALGDIARADLDSHLRYLSGLLAAIGVAYWTAIPEIEKEGAKIGLLTAIVVAGGFARAVGMLIMGPPGPIMTGALGMELIVAPALFFWQQRVQRLAAATPVPVDAA